MPWKPAASAPATSTIGWSPTKQHSLGATPTCAAARRKISGLGFRISEVRAWREHERLRFWPGIVKRWASALVFALASAAVAGAGYGWVTEPYAAELAKLRSQFEFADFIEHRIITMTPAERRQLDALMRWDTPPTRDGPTKSR